ncbi:hypothetical protein ACXM5X_32520, partial [Pseudomonas saponiphila]
EGVGATAAALVDLSTVAGNKISNPPWVKFQSAGWVNFPSAPTWKAKVDLYAMVNMPLTRLPHLNRAKSPGSPTINPGAVSSP